MTEPTMLTVAPLSRSSRIKASRSSTTASGEVFPLQQAIARSRRRKSAGRKPSANVYHMEAGLAATRDEGEAERRPLGQLDLVFWLLPHKSGSDMIPSALPSDEKAPDAPTQPNRPGFMMITKGRNHETYHRGYCVPAIGGRGPG